MRQRLFIQRGCVCIFMYTRLCMAVCVCCMKSSRRHLPLTQRHVSLHSVVFHSFNHDGWVCWTACECISENVYVCMYIHPRTFRKLMANTVMGGDSFTTSTCTMHFCSIHILLHTISFIFTKFIHNPEPNIYLPRPLDNFWTLKFLNCKPTEMNLLLYVHIYVYILQLFIKLHCLHHQRRRRLSEGADQT